MQVTEQRFGALLQSLAGCLTATRPHRNVLQRDGLIHRVCTTFRMYQQCDVGTGLRERQASARIACVFNVRQISLTQHILVGRVCRGRIEVPDETVRVRCVGIARESMAGCYTFIN